MPFPHQTRSAIARRVNGYANVQSRANDKQKSVACQKENSMSSLRRSEANSTKLLLTTRGTSLCLTSIEGEARRHAYNAGSLSQAHIQ